jgi:radical SAM superfamily enzyme YgiQ (UPF0313 family)
VPRFDLVDTGDYVMFPIQFSRGCPYLCEFCDITVLFGRRPRTKSAAQFLRELDALAATGFRGQVFVVDDNFIGNKREVMKLLPEIARWNREHGSPFNYGTEADLNLADNPVLLQQMVEAGFISVFIGIETPSLESLRETRKHQNLRGSLLDRVAAVQRAGLLVYAGFIVGFDNDTEDIFDRQIEFITQSAIANAMIGPLMALPGTPLFERMKREGRLLEADDYGNWYESGFTNIMTTIPRKALLEGHRRVVRELYDPGRYFDRALRGFERLPRAKSFGGRWQYFRWLVKTVLHGSSSKSGNEKPSLRQLAGFLGSVYRGFPPEFRGPLMHFLAQILRKCPEQLPACMSFIFMGYHCYRYTAEFIIPKIDETLAAGDEPTRMRRRQDLVTISGTRRQIA